ncbi:MAG: hydrogenase 4 subunit B [gamma proteobacterium symbiont of Bathyaustriella thionipta]|nr:hydrogenase 4 subunit B [gamma proteobacterium symbiont of Bathyaustriella thionipta]
MTDFSPLLLAELAILAVLLSALSALATRHLPALMRQLVIPLMGFSGLLALLAGVWTLGTGQNSTAILPIGLPWLPWQLHLDALAGLFLSLVGGITFIVSFYAPAYVREFEHGNDSLPALGGFTGLFIAGMQMVILSDGAFVFMVSWELMSLSSYFLVTFQHEKAANRRAGFLYLLMAHIGGLSILLGYALLAAYGHGLSFEAMRAASLPEGWATLAFLLALFGFGMKAGLLPVHVWLPEAHPVAPSHISALMSGVMLKVAVYGLIRFTWDLLGDVHWQWGVTLLIVGSLSAIMGVLYAMMQQNMKRLLAYSSVENIGIIFIGLGLSAIFSGTGHPALAVIGLVAALYHALNHAMFKSLMFLAAGAVLHSTREHDLDQMGGLLRRMPWTGLFFLLGCISIAALPPFNGFVSEWLTFQTSLQAWALDSGILRTLLPIAAAVLALTGAIAAATFVKLYGIAFLGRARSRRARRAREVSLGMRSALAMLAIVCLLLGILPTLVIDTLNSIPQQLLGKGLEQATAHGWLWLTPVSAETASYSAPLVFIGALLTWWLAQFLLRRGSVRKVRYGDPCDCGFGTPNARMQYTSVAFAQPMRRVFADLFRLREEVTRDEQGRERHQLQVEDPLWDWLYLPLARAVNALSKLVSRLQSGNVRIYLGWSLATLVVLLWLIS